MTDQETVGKIQAIYTALDQRWAEFREAALRNYRFVVGDQLTKEVREILRKENRPEMIFNMMQGKVVALAGTISQNRTYMKAVPVREGDEKLAEMHTVLVSDYAMTNCNGDEEIAKAAIDAAIAKIGWVNNYIDFRKNPEGDWVTESFDPMMIMFDPLCRKKDLSDCKYYVVSAFYTADEILSIYRKSLTPEMVKKIREEDARLNQTKAGDKPRSWWERLAAGVEDLFTRKSDEERVSERNSVSQWLDTRSGVYRVIEFHDRRMDNKKVLYSPMDRQSKEMRKPGEDESPEDYETFIQQSAQEMGGIAIDLNDEQLWQTVVIPGLLPNDVVFEQAYAVQGVGFQHKPIFCYNFHPDVTKTASILDVLIDPQSSFNQRQMSALELVMDAVHPNLLLHENSVSPQYLDDWKSKARGVVKYWKGENKPVKEEANSSAIQGLQMLADEHKGLADELTGITPNVTGTSETKNESGRLYNARVRQGTVMMAYYMSNITFSMKQIFKYCDKNLQHFIKMPRAIRLLNKTNDPTWLKLNVQTINGVLNDVTQGEFDFVIDNSQLGETAKQLQQAAVGDLLQVIPPEFILWPKVIKMMDIADGDEMAQFAQQIMGMKMGAAQQQMKMKQEQDKLGLIAQTAGTVQQLEGAASPEQQAA